MFDLEEELKKLPASPGVYLMHNNRDEIIYVGKAISLKNRVRQYFQSSRNKTAKIEQMVSHIAWFEYILTDSELEALVLECNLIKEHRPRYNTMLKDDKTYPYIKATVGEEFPRLLFSRDMKKDGKSRYFGPYTSAGAVKDTLDLIHKLYRIRTCNRNLPRDTGKERPCLNYHIKQCDAPCQGYISREDYLKSFGQALDFLNGRYAPLIKSLEEKMNQASEDMEFERAIEYRELLNSVKQVAQKQKITSSGREDRDIIAMARDEQDAVVQVFFIREGKLIGRDHFHLQAATAENDGEILDSFIKQFYAGTPFIPRELWLQVPVMDEEVISRWLTERRGQKVKIVVPKKGEKERLVELAARNAALVLSQDKERIKKEELRTIGAMNQVGGLIGLDGVRRIEAFDISNTSGVESVGSMVVYEDGRPKRSDYRKFKIRTVKGPDDYASMREVLTRRFSHGLREVQEHRESGEDLSAGSFTRFPDLIMMDGGRGQVNIALEVLNSLGLSIPVCGMVKDDFHRTRGLYYNNVEVPIDRHSEGFRLITRIQDEAHRFAIEYHRSLRGKGQVKSVLDDIPGIGPARRKALMREFKDIEAIRAAEVEDLAKVPQMNERAARQVYEFFRKPAAAEEEQPGEP
ncbi:excinuclease ABC subunit UvrC [Clostridium sp. AF18-27]|nr:MULTISPECIES: excinuclease ABC subunit UvrC [Enterocloster]MBS5604297.1 excinuclease ABC subunit UvrC [Enterocloster asparagiformis]RHR57740.1 excinuclease ABC subunit UvrC [Clostridium sp. AF18-27]MCB6347046.1 excinuclease ABC subunit UvrC [Enterocloster lavalensis]MDR3756592.1 excinuclease ABC subunit UvrC [Enterocloster sp.]PST31517.1 excinuclease ABC subunit C [Enterocloster lavalensis]